MHLLPHLFCVILLFLIEDALKDAVARYLVHFENFVSYDSIHALWRQVVHHAPIRILVHKLIFKATAGVLGNVGPLTPHRQLLKERRVLLLDDTHLLLCLLVVHLVRLVLDDETFETSRVLPLTSVSFRLEQVTHAATEFVVALFALYLTQITRLLLVSRGNRGELFEFGTHLLGWLVPQAVVQHFVFLRNKS